jgi:hypothetical protein
MQNSTRAVVLKVVILRLSKILSADGRASASKIEKIAKNLIKKSEFFSKVEYLCLLVGRIQ